MFDIDDIFVGEPGTRIGVSDVDAMIAFMDKWKEQIPGFHFVVGFSGKFFNRGNDTEDAGDAYILEKRGRKTSFSIQNPSNFRSFPLVRPYVQSYEINHVRRRR